MTNLATTPVKLSGLAIILVMMLALSPSQKIYGQLGDLGDLLEGGREDAQLLFKEYLTPFASGFGAGVNAGWTDRSKTHGMLGFHVKLNLSAAVVPDVDQSFDINQLGLSTLQVLQDGPETPTFSGSSSGAARLGFSQYGLELADFRMPPGTGFSYILTPMVQAGVGIPKKTEVMVRFIPPLKFLDYGEMYLYGLGIKHELNQWLPGGMFLPVTFSVMGGFTAFGSSADLNARPEDFDPANDLDPNNFGGPGSATWDDQEIQFSTNAWTVNLLVGKSLPVLSVYGGVGVEGSTTSVNLKGNFPYYMPEAENGEFKRELNAFEDPFDLSFDGSNTLRGMAGVRISLPLITFNIEYTLADYSLLTAGLGISLR
ncbi:MAG: DUF6588 family protein [Bacteroidota bacterium]